MKWLIFWASLFICLFVLIFLDSSDSKEGRLLGVDEHEKALPDWDDRPLTKNGDAGISPDLLKSVPYSIGDPTGEEQLYLEYINRARSNASAEAMRLLTDSSPSVDHALQYFGIKRADVLEQYKYYVREGLMDNSAQPLSFNEGLLRVSRLHSADMSNVGGLSHVSSQNPPKKAYSPGSRLAQRFKFINYPYLVCAENCGFYEPDINKGHAAYVIDWGKAESGSPIPQFEGQGMQNMAGHRRNVHNDQYKEIGVGIFKDESNKGYVTQDFGLRRDSPAFVTGVAYCDLNGNDFYDVGEGVVGIKVATAASHAYAVTTNSGGYSIPITKNGKFKVEFSMKGVIINSKTFEIRELKNVKVDLSVPVDRFDPTTKPLIN